MSWNSTPSHQQIGLHVAIGADPRLFCRSAATCARLSDIAWSREGYGLPSVQRFTSSCRKRKGAVTSREGRSVTETVGASEIVSLPLPPRCPLPYRERLAALKQFPYGADLFRAAGGPVTRFQLAPSWLLPQIVVVTSPQGIRDVMTSRGGSIDKTRGVPADLRWLLGPNLFVVPHQEWTPRRRTLQPVFTKQAVNEFGGHMAAAAESVSGSWRAGDEVDLDAESRQLTMRALGHSVLGQDLTDHTEAITDPMRTVFDYVVARATNPLRAPRWLPTPPRQRARAAAGTIRHAALEIVRACRVDSHREAPLVRALIAAADPETGQPLTDTEIADELIIFMLAGHDTTATAICYALWALGRHRDIQDRVAAEVSELGNRRLMPDDVPSLRYTRQVLQESLRLCPPAAVGSRVTTRDVAVDGYRVPAGSTLMFSRMSVHRDSHLWPDPLRFDPERFAEQNSRHRDRWSYTPFGAGPRSCIGDHFAMLEATLALATVVRDVEITALHDDFPTTASFTLMADGRIPARIARRRCSTSPRIGEPSELCLTPPTGQPGPD